MGLVLSLVCLALGLLAFAYQRDIADALTAFPYLIGELARRRSMRSGRWPTFYLGWKHARVAPPPRQTHEIWLRFIRFWAILMSSAWTMVVFILLVPVCSAFAQETTADRLQPSCGPNNVQFDVRTTRHHAEATIEPGKAQVYVGQIFVRPPFLVSGPTVRVGVDGTWMGAVHGNSYLVLSVAPGEHHVCMQYQSFQQRMTRKAAFTSFTAEAGKRYYFRVRFSYNVAMDMEPVNPDEGQYLVSFLALSVSRPKK